MIRYKEVTCWSCNCYFQSTYRDASSRYIQLVPSFPLFPSKQIQHHPSTHLRRAYSFKANRFIVAFTFSSSLNSYILPPSLSALLRDKQHPFHISHFASFRVAWKFYFSAPPLFRLLLPLRYPPTASVHSSASFSSLKIGGTSKHLTHTHTPLLPRPGLDYDSGTTFIDIRSSPPTVFVWVVRINRRRAAKCQAIHQTKTANDPFHSGKHHRHEAHIHCHIKR